MLHEERAPAPDTVVTGLLFNIEGRVWRKCTVGMAERQQRQRLRTLQNNRQLARFTVQGRATGKQLGTGSYGSVEEVWEGL